MQGFYIERANPHARSNITTNKTNRKPTCLTCKLKEKCRNKRIPPIGNLDGSVLVVWGSVTASEDKAGTMLMEDQLIRIKRTLSQNHVNVRDCCFVRAVRCCTESPTDKEIISCSEHLYSLVSKGSFSNVLLIGKQAVTAFFSYQDNDFATYARLRGMTVPDLKYGVYVSVINEPIEDSNSRYGQDIIGNTLFLNDVAAFIPFHKKRIPGRYKKHRDFIFPCTSAEAVKEMDKVLRGKYRDFIAFDFETTGLRPYNKGHQIVSCSIAVSKEYCFSFMMTKKTAKWLKKILRNPNIPKVAANMKFEKTWSKVILSCTVNNFLLDTVVAAHVIDNRAKVTAVKFQAFALFGIYGYEKAVEPYIGSSAEDKDRLGCNAMNTMLQCPEDLMLEYVGLDSLLEYWIALEQMDKVL